MTKIDPRDEDRELDAFDEIDLEEFAPIAVSVQLVRMLIHGDTRDQIALTLRLPRDEVDARIAAAAVLVTGESLIERLAILQWRVGDLVQQASIPEVSQWDQQRLLLLLDLCRMDLDLVDRQQARQVGRP